MITQHDFTPVWRKPGDNLKQLDRRRFLGAIGVGIPGAMLATAASAQQTGQCLVTPDSGEGPFYFNPDLLRNDIREDAEGAVLTLDVQVQRAGDCAVLEGARFDLWHADALGLYSGYRRQSGVGGVSTAPIRDSQRLRGTQVTDAEGRVQFRTIYPSWYGGRTPHLHFKVFLGDDGSGDEVVATQLYLPDDMNRRVFENIEPYRTHVHKRETFNDTDMFVQRDPMGGAMCIATEVGGDAHEIGRAHV